MRRDAFITYLLLALSCTYGNAQHSSEARSDIAECSVISAIRPPNIVHVWLELEVRVDLTDISVDLIMDRDIIRVETRFGIVTKTADREFRVFSRQALRSNDKLKIELDVFYDISMGAAPKIRAILLNNSNVCQDARKNLGASRERSPINPFRPSSSSAPSRNGYYPPPTIVPTIKSRRELTDRARDQFVTSTRRVNVHPIFNTYPQPTATTANPTFYNGDFAAEKSVLTVPKTCGSVLPKITPLAFFAKESSFGQFPWHAAIYTSGDGQLKYICGGSLIAPAKVITAAHCVTHSNSSEPIDPQKQLVYFGKHHLSRWVGDEQNKQVRQIVVHPDYKPTVFYSDVAILQLKASVDITDVVRPVCLWNFDDDLNNIVDEIGKVPGWGHNEHGKFTEDLSFVKMPVVSQATCIWSNNEFFGRITSERSFCAGYKNGTSVCNGDSGGGLVLERNNKWHLRGIVSIGVAKKNSISCDTYQYAVFTDVAKVLDWIQLN